jgi:hypothetical protein
MQVYDIARLKYDTKYHYQQANKKVANALWSKMKVRSQHLVQAKLFLDERSRYPCQTAIRSTHELITSGQLKKGSIVEFTP